MFYLNITQLQDYGDMISNGYLKVMFKIPKTGHLPTLWIQYVDLQTTFTTRDHRDPSSKLTDWSQWLDCSKPQLGWWYIYPIICPLLLGCSHCIPIIIKERYMIYANMILIRIIRHMRHILYSNCIYIKYYWFFPLGTHRLPFDFFWWILIVVSWQDPGPTEGPSFSRIRCTSSQV